MSSDVDMSLEDIIQKKRINKRNNKSQPYQLKKQYVRPATDARNKIISKKRTQIFDAREKLAELAKQKDARLKLEQLRSKKMVKRNAQGRKLPFHQDHIEWWLIPSQNPERGFTDPTRHVSQSHLPNKNINKKMGTRKGFMEMGGRKGFMEMGGRKGFTETGARKDFREMGARKGFMEARTIASRSLDYSAHLKPILRTVENDVIMLDPVEDRYERPNVPPVDHKANLNLKIITHNADVRDKHNVMRRIYESDKDKSPPRPPSILKKRPMAALRTEKKIDKPEVTVAAEYRIIVSNLRSSVTGSDIQELFGDIGGLLESRLVRPGTAEVMYKRLEDAQKAVDLYHNRQLDGQPMNCLLVNPRPMKSSPRITGLPASSSSNVEPDLSTFHKVLFSNL